MVACTTEFTGQAVGVAEPELILRANTLAVGLMTLTKSVVKTGVLSVDFFGYLHPFTGGLEINTVGLTLVYMFFHKNTGLLFPHSRWVVWRSGDPVLGASSEKWTQKSHPSRENDVSASSCVQLFACWSLIQLSASPPWRTVPLCALGTITLVSWSSLMSCSGH